MKNIVYCIERAESVIDNKIVPAKELEWFRMSTKEYQDKYDAFYDRITLQKDDSTHLYRVRPVGNDNKKDIINKFINKK